MAVRLCPCTLISTTSTPPIGYVNNKRANNPFGETANPSWKSANDFSKLGKCTYPGYDGVVFEPNDEYKGDFARTYFYMVTCYEEQLPTWYTNNAESRPTLDGNKYPGLSDWQLEMLMKWSKNDPVSEKEINRNIAVWDIQNNRNPFIDYPGFEEYIWGDKMDEAFSYDGSASGIQNIEENDEVEGYYSIDGKRLQKPQRGVNIVKTKSRRTKKIIKR